ncbi:hypothetical protein BZG36_03580 [Bifiguratus adelaidae]|uniref:Glucosamine-6-phosphate deaminase n=1 Tax=Bifiguratus adelaidae TaxID=1938954 RepID=A0A261Y0B8_9FUNG|nr:hypothetical protein BZG36_03580 [Bifiguratus adelaidae]
MRLIIRPNYDTVSEYMAQYIKERINQFKPTSDRPFVLGLPTGSSPIGTYKKLVEYFQAGQISFKNVITFNMDEYVGLPRDHPESYHSFMWNNFFRHVDIQPENVHILNGNARDLDEECRLFEEKIKQVGGIELFLGGKCIGPDGHIAFNEPGSSLASKTRVKTLAYETIIANARFFEGDINKVPKLALTVGVQTVMDAREVAVLITGAHKAIALAKCIEEGVNHMWTVSAIQLHPKSLIVCDEDATLELHTVKYFKSIEHVQNSLVGKENVGLQGGIKSIKADAFHNNGVEKVPGSMTSNLPGPYDTRHRNLPPKFVAFSRGSRMSSHGEEVDEHASGSQSQRLDEEANFEEDENLSNEELDDSTDDDIHLTEPIIVQNADGQLVFARPGEAPVPLFDHHLILSDEFDEAYDPDLMDLFVDFDPPRTLVRRRHRADSSASELSETDANIGEYLPPNEVVPPIDVHDDESDDEDFETDSQRLTFWIKELRDRIAAQQFPDSSQPITNMWKHPFYKSDKGHPLRFPWSPTTSNHPQCANAISIRKSKFGTFNQFLTLSGYFVEAHPVIPLANGSFQLLRDTANLRHRTAPVNDRPIDRFQDSNVPVGTNYQRYSTDADVLRSDRNAFMRMRERPICMTQDFGYLVVGGSEGTISVHCRMGSCANNWQDDNGSTALCSLKIVPRDGGDPPIANSVQLVRFAGVRRSTTVANDADMDDSNDDEIDLSTSDHYLFVALNEEGILVFRLPPHSRCAKYQSQETAKAKATDQEPAEPIYLRLAAQVERAKPTEPKRFGSLMFVEHCRDFFGEPINDCKVAPNGRFMISVCDRPFIYLSRLRRPIQHSGADTTPIIQQTKRHKIPDKYLKGLWTNSYQVSELPGDRVLAGDENDIFRRSRVPLSPSSFRSQYISWNASSTLFAHTSDTHPLVLVWSVVEENDQEVKVECVRSIDAAGTTYAITFHPFAEGVFAFTNRYGYFHTVDLSQGTLVTSTVNCDMPKDGKAESEPLLAVQVQVIRNDLTYISHPSFHPRHEITMVSYSDFFPKGYPYGAYSVYEDELASEDSSDDDYEEDDDDDDRTHTSEDSSSHPNRQRSIIRILSRLNGLAWTSDGRNLLVASAARVLLYRCTSQLLPARSLYQICMDEIRATMDKAFISRDTTFDPRSSECQDQMTRKRKRRSDGMNEIQGSLALRQFLENWPLGAQHWLSPKHLLGLPDHIQQRISNYFYDDSH